MPKPIVRTPRNAQLDTAAAVIGFGMGGVFDFMVLQLVFQWHNMISNRVPVTTLEALRLNNFWDGIGELIMWVFVWVGLFLLIRAVRGNAFVPTTLRVVGLFILGWGVFNFVDGILNHHILALHNVREDAADKDFWNIWFLVLAGIVQPFAGWLIARAGRRPDTLS